MSHSPPSTTIDERFTAQTSEAIASLWSRFVDDTSPSHRISAVLGVATDDIAGLALILAAGSTDAGELVHTAPEVLRTLRSSTSMAEERCVGHVLGPVLWADTLNARAHTLGAEDVFVCGVPARDFDIAENQVLVAALDMVGRSIGYLDQPVAAGVATHRLGAARAHAIAARSTLRNELLDGIRRDRAGNLQIHRAQQGRRSKQYHPAVSVLRRRTDPFKADELVDICDPHTGAQLRAIHWIETALAARGATTSGWRCEGVEVVAGPIRYRNRRHATSAGSHGILVGQLLVDAADPDDPAGRAEVLQSLEGRAGGRRFCLVATPSEAEMAAELALSIA